MALFISFEGPDGSGKSTQVRLLAAALRQDGHEVVETREPGGTALGERIRDVLLNPEAPEASPLAMIFLLSAARTQHVADVIRPALERGAIVITDRYADSTIAYQAFGLGEDLDTTRTLSNIATGCLYPDVVVYLDIDPAAGLARVAARGPANRLDSETLAFHQRVRNGYLSLARDSPNHWITIDGSQSPQSVHEAILRALKPLLPEVFRTR